MESSSAETRSGNGSFLRGQMADRIFLPARLIRRFQELQLVGYRSKTMSWKTESFTILDLKEIHKMVA